MNRCAHDGYLVSATAALPTDPTDLHVDELPIVGCSNVLCGRCNVAVRSVAGRDLRREADLEPARLAVLYAVADLAGSAELKDIDPSHRLYLCRCTRWVETGAHACRAVDFDPQTDPDVPWACGGHPVMTLPHDLDGVAVPTQAALFEVVLEGLRGVHPPRTRPADRERGDWVVRLPARLGPADAAVVVRAARASLEAPVARARAGALRFFRSRPDPVAQARVLELVIARSPLLVGVPDEVTPFPQADPTLEDAAWRVIAPLVAVAGPARTQARAAALAGHGRRAVFAALAAHDAAWLVASIEAVVRAAPARAKDLNDSLGVLPPELPRKAVRDRITAAVAAGSGAPVAATPPPAGELSFDAALASPGTIVAAWDYQSEDDNEVRLYAVSAAGAHHLATKQVPVDQCEALYEHLRARGLRIGGVYPYSGHVWVMDDAGMAVWSKAALLAEGSPTELRLGGRLVRAADVARVLTFTDAADAGHRGVRCELTGGGAVVVAEEFDPPRPAMFDDADTRDDDERWAVYVGFGLATWLGVPHVERDGRVTNADHLVVVAAARALAAEVEALPARGPFEDLAPVIGTFRTGRDLTLRVAPDPVEADQRFLELKVWTPDGTRWRGRWLKQGTAAQLAGYLRRYRTAQRILRTAADLSMRLAGNEFS